MKFWENHQGVTLDLEYRNGFPGVCFREYREERGGVPIFLSNSYSSPAKLTQNLFCSFCSTAGEEVPATIPISGGGGKVMCGVLHT